MKRDNSQLCREEELLTLSQRKMPMHTILRTGPGWGVGGGICVYKLHGYVPPQRVWFFSCFGLKTGIDFDHYGLHSGMVFKGTTGAYKLICLFNSK